MIWFAYQASPLGPNIRMKKAFFLGWRDEVSEPLVDRVSKIFSVEEVDSRGIDGKYLTSLIDPDMNDVVGEEILELVRIQ